MDGADIAVVGGGASAVCLLDALVTLDGPPGGVTIFEPGPHLWRGRPYQRDTEVLRLNATPDDMSVRHGDPGQFERWLAARDLVVGVPAEGPGPLDPYSGARFASRTVYGEYLEHSARANLMALIERGWRVDIVRERVVSAAPTAEGGALLRTEQGRRFQADHVVLCVGGGATQDSYGLSGSPRFLVDPYPLSGTLDSLQDFDQDSRVGIIGSGLTAVDVVLALVARGHRGPISLLSRGGVLPAVRQRPVRHDRRHFTPERLRAAAQRGPVTLDTAVRLLDDELTAAGEDLTTVAAEVTALHREEPVARLRRQFAEVDSTSIALRIVQAAVPDTGPDLWSLLPDNQKADLIRRHYRSVLTLCCPMPAASAATLLSLIERGQLRIVRGLQRIAAPGVAHSGGFTVTTDTHVLRADHIVNAVSPPAHRIPAAAAELVDSLVIAGVASRNPVGGLHVDRATSRLTVDGRPHPRFYALGDLAFGSLFFTFGIPAMVDRAHEIGSALREDMSVVRRTRRPASALAAPR
ncbi:FAD/NAD(P)-binding protein [Micromonospora sp. BQ11]|uniref:FAD/NAD(P)-binding protein n=1 Tax=Micromonospora sp. BQ11 TaxID=3452212 RepID=UPI003F899DEF